MKEIELELKEEEAVFGELHDNLEGPLAEVLCDSLLYTDQADELIRLNAEIGVQCGVKPKLVYNQTIT